MERVLQLTITATADTICRWSLFQDFFPVTWLLTTESDPVKQQKMTFHGLMIILVLQGSTEKTSLGEFPTKHRTLYIHLFLQLLVSSWHRIRSTSPAWISPLRIISVNCSHIPITSLQLYLWIILHSSSFWARITTCKPVAETWKVQS
jgi:hypothetical protein